MRNWEVSISIWKGGIVFRGEWKCCRWERIVKSYNFLQDAVFLKIFIENRNNLRYNIHVF